MDNNEILKNTFLFTNLDEDKFFQLSSLVEEISVPAGVVFVKEGDKADALYIIKEGNLQVFTMGQQNDEIVLAKLENGAFFGEQAILDKTPVLRNASVMTLTDSVLLKVKNDLFFQILQSDNTLKKELEKIGEQEMIKLKTIKEPGAKRRATDDSP